MSVPNRSEDGIDDPLSYAPRWVRQSQPVAPEQSTTFAPSTAPVITNTSGAAARITNTPPMAPGIRGHNIDLPPPGSRPFEGDVAIKDLKRRLSLDPKVVPEPPIPKERKPVVWSFGRLSFVAIIAAIIMLGVLLMMFLDEAWKPAGGIAGVAAPPREGLPRVAAPQPDASEPPAVIQLDPDAIATLERFLKDGDILSARLLLKRAASAGNAQAALELGMTFDPAFLAERGVVGFAPDVAQARGWYERAAELGSIEASRFLERLAGR
jgi:hypothetical protein